MLKNIKRLGTSCKGVASIEFALVVPMLLSLLLGVVELSQYTMLKRRAALAADFAADYLSRDSDNTLNWWERVVVEDIWMMVNPTSFEARKPRDGMWANGYSRALGSAAFVPDDPNCLGVNCDYTVDVAFSFLVPDIIENPVQLACDVEIVSNATKLNGRNIPEGLVGRAPIVTVDFVYPYKALTVGFLFDDHEIHVNSMRKTRSGQVLIHPPDQWVTQC